MPESFAYFRSMIAALAYVTGTYSEDAFYIAPCTRRHAENVLDDLPPIYANDPATVTISNVLQDFRASSSLVQAARVFDADMEHGLIFTHRDIEGNSLGFVAVKA